MRSSVAHGFLAITGSCVQNFGTTVIIITIWTVMTCIQGYEIIVPGLQLLMTEIPSFPAIFMGCWLLQPQDTNVLVHSPGKDFAETSAVGAFRFGVLMMCFKLR